MVVPSSGVSGMSLVYWSAFSAASCFWWLVMFCGLGMVSVIGMDCSGLVPQVTTGNALVRSISMMVSYVAFGSEANDAHVFFFDSTFFGVYFLFSRYWKVVSSGEMSPDLAPHSMAMLQMVMRSSMELFFI